ncbi:MAG: hypothetical protein VW239_07870, partial [Candidatus Nanopelagicales bacterium]
ALKRNPDDAEARAEVDALMAQAGDLADKVKVADAAASEAARVAEEAWLELSNIVDMRSPVGGEEDFAVLEHVGTPRDFAAEGFEPRDHIDLGELLGAIDIERAAKVFIDASFKKLRSAEDAFALLRSFAAIESEGAIGKTMADKFNDILEQFTREIVEARERRRETRGDLG